MTHLMFRKMKNTLVCMYVFTHPTNKLFILQTEQNWSLGYYHSSTIHSHYECNKNDYVHVGMSK